MSRFARHSASWRSAPVPRSTRSRSPRARAPSPARARAGAGARPGAGPAPRSGRGRWTAGRSARPASRSAPPATCSPRAARRGRCRARSPASKCSASSFAIAWIRAVIAMVCSSRVCASQERTSTVPEVRMRAHVPPQVRVVGHRARLDHELDALAVLVPALEPRRDPDARQEAEDAACATTSSSVGRAAPERRVGRQREQDREVHTHAVRDVDRLVGVVDADVHVQAEQQLLAHDEAERVDDLAVALALHDALVLPVGKRVGRRGADRESLRLGCLAHAPAQVLELSGRLCRRCGTRRWRSRAPTGSAPASPDPRSRAEPPRSSPRSPRPAPSTSGRRSSAPPRPRGCRPGL